MTWLVRKDLTVVRHTSLGGNAQVQIPSRPLRSSVTCDQFLDLSENCSQDPSRVTPDPGGPLNKLTASFIPQIRPEPTRCPGTALDMRILTKHPTLQC